MAWLSAVSGMWVAGGGIAYRKLLAVGKSSKNLFLVGNLRSKMQNWGGVKTFSLRTFWKQKNEILSTHNFLCRKFATVGIPSGNGNWMFRLGAYVLNPRSRRCCTLTLTINLTLTKTITPILSGVVAFRLIAFRLIAPPVESTAEPQPKSN